MKAAPGRGPGRERRSPDPSREPRKTIRNLWAHCHHFEGSPTATGGEITERVRWVNIGRKTMGSVDGWLVGQSGLLQTGRLGAGFVFRSCGTEGFGAA